MTTRILSKLRSQSLTSLFVHCRHPVSKSKNKVLRQSNSFRTFNNCSISMKQYSISSDVTLSAPRAAAAVSLLPTYLADARAIEKYSSSTPNGALQLSVAENQMLEDLLLPALAEFSLKQTFPADAIYYQPTHGRESLRMAASVYLRDLLELEQSLDPDGIVVGAGCNAVLENLCMTLAEPGQGVMIPLPYYAAFDFDLGSRAGLKVVPVPTMDHSGVPYRHSHPSVPAEAYYPTRAALDSAKQKSINEKGIEPRILLLSHPQNPLGICYPPHVIQECIDWCRDNRVHLVSDEIYAGSVYRKEEATFTSVLKLATRKSSPPSEYLGLGPYVHFVYALSKDFALSGLRVGLSYSENLEIRLPLQKLNDLCCVSSHTQLFVERMLTEKGNSGLPWTREFLQKSHERLRQRGDAWKSCLQELEIPHLPATAGLFCWMDFSEFLPTSQDSPDEQERVLYLELLQNYGLLFTPGRSMRNELPGYFRCVFTAANDKEFVLGMERLRKYVAEKRNV
jgi:aspartate/methionine/tyrosine aminotransferase